MLIAGFAFKIAAVPLHFYAGDVYQGAATPVTAFLSSSPRPAGMVALIKMLYMRRRRTLADRRRSIVKLLWILAVLTMTVGNVLGLLQHNIKRVLAYSSIAHSGYMLVGLAALAAARPTPAVQHDGTAGRAVLPRRLRHHERRRVRRADDAPASRRDLDRREPIAAGDDAETFEDLAGQGRKHRRRWAWRWRSAASA